MALYHSARGSVDYTIVGSPTIVDSVVSGFSGSSYVQSSSVFPGSTSTSLEFATKFNISSFASTSTIVSSTTNTIPFHLAVRDSKFRLYPGIESTYKVGDFVLSENTDYFIKLIWDSTNGWKLQYSTDGRNYTTDFENYNPSNSAPKDNYIVLGRNYPNGGQEGLLGTLDLKNTYIIVNGQPWFGICPIEVKKHQLMGPVGYTVVGSPTITDGVLTGVSSGNDCYTSSSLPTFNELEIVFKAKRYTWPSAATILPICAFGAGNSNRRLTPNASSDATGGTRLFNGSTIVVNIPNSYFDLQTYGPLGYYTRIKVTKNTSDYTYELGLSADGNTWVTNSANYSTNMCTGAVYFLRNSSGYTGSNGEMDLNETYIKVNGKLWFWQPRETEKIVVNGVQVWQKPS